MYLPRWIERHAAFLPDREAIRFLGESITYRDFAHRIERAVGRLAALDVGDGDVVAFLGYNNPEMLALLFACARRRAILTPLNWRLAAPEHAYILRDSRARVVIVEQAFLKHAEPLRAEFAAMTWLALSEAAPGWRTWQDVAALSAHGEVHSSAADAAVVLCYTSGSTGTPKGVVLTQSALFWNAINSAHMHDMTSVDRVLTTSPMFHVGGLNVQTTPALHAGASVSLHARFDPGETLAAIENERITLAVLVPAQLVAVMEHPRWMTADLSSLRAVTTGSTIVSESFVRKVQARGIRIIQVYGSTETCPVSAYQRVDSSERKAGAAGLPGLHCDIRIVDRDDREVGRGEVGEILVRGGNVMREYWHAPQATAAALRNGWYHSGDLGHFDEEGYLYVDARKTDMIISGGENIYPAEIESALMECPDIADASVVSRPDPRWGEAVVAVVVLRPGVRMGEDDVLALLSGRIARYKHPREVHFMDALPRTGSGKVMRDKLRTAVSTAYTG